MHLPSHSGARGARSGRSELAEQFTTACRARRTVTCDGVEAAAAASPGRRVGPGRLGRRDRPRRLGVGGQLVDFGFARTFRKSDWLKTACGSPGCVGTWPGAKRRDSGWGWGVARPAPHISACQTAAPPTRAPPAPRAAPQDRGARGARPEPGARGGVRAGGGPVVGRGDALLDAVRLPALLQRLRRRADPPGGPARRSGVGTRTPSAAYLTQTDRGARPRPQLAPISAPREWRRARPCRRCWQRRLRPASVRDTAPTRCPET